MHVLKIISLFRIALVAIGMTIVTSFCGPVLAETAAKCVQDLCGATSNKTQFLQSPEQQARINHDFDTGIRRLFLAQVMLAIERRQDNSEMQRLALDKITQTKEIQIPDQLRVMANLKYVVETMYTSEVYNSIAKINGHAVENQDKLKQALSKAGVSDVEHAAQAIVAIANSAAVIYFELPSHSKISTIQRNGTKTFSEWVDSFMSIIKVSYVLQGGVSEFLVPAKPRLLGSYLMKEQITDDDSEELFKEVAKALLVLDALNFSDPSTLRKSLLFMKRDLRLVALAALHNARPPIQDYQPIIESTMQLCEKNFKNRMNSIPTEDSIQAFKQTFLPKANEGLAKVVAKLNLTASTVDVRSIQWNLPLAYPVEFEQQKQHLTWPLQDHEGVRKARAHLKEALKQNNPTALAYAVVSAAIITKDEHALTDRIEDCRRIRPRSNYDAFSLSRNTISLGWQTILGIEQAFTVGHEVGHYLFRNIKNLSPSTKNCLLEKHTGLQNGEKYNEEDFADLVGVELEQAMDAPSDTRGFCSHRDLENPSANISSLIQSGSAPHSTDLFRLINVANQRGHVSTNCRQLAREAKAQHLLTRCELKP